MQNRKSNIDHRNQKMLQADQDEQYFNQSSHSPQSSIQNNSLKHDSEPDQKDDSEDDPLDAYMNDLDQTVKLQQQQPVKKKLNKQILDFGQEYQEYPCVEVDNMNEPRQKFMDEVMSDEQEIEEQNKKNKIIEPLKAFDFSEVVLEDFEKNFYEEHQEISDMTPDLHKKLLKQFQIKVNGAEPIPKPVVSFAHLPLTHRIIRVLQQEKYETPTPIQAQALPCAFSGRDVVGIAKTGSGKTLAFVWPMIIHVLQQRRSGKGQGPIALILAPTRELCQQIYIQTKKYSRKQGIKVDCLLGGQNKHEQWKSLKVGTDILIASPGRLIQLIKKKATNLLRTTFLVLDQADRMLSMGFQQQIRSIISQIRQDRQTLLFTATMKRSMQVLVGDIVTSPIRITVGSQSSANEDVKQEVIMINDISQKVEWLKMKIMRLIIEGKVLIFVNQKGQCEDIGHLLQQQMKIPTLVIHGDKTQYQRTTIMNSFKGQESVLVATDIASRGIDVKNIKTVINYDCPKNMQIYIHRIGRAGRAGQIGTSYTFLEKSNVRFAVGLVGIFENSGYPVPDQLQDLAMLDDGYRKKRMASKMGVSFAKGKDATKYLNFALKRHQKRGNSRAGIGLEEYKNNKGVGQLGLNEQIRKSDSISDISGMIRKRMEQEEKNRKFDGHFMLGKNVQREEKVSEPTITYYKKKKKDEKKQ